MKKDTIIRSYNSKKKYRKDLKRMLDRGFEIEHEMIIVGELQVEYSKRVNRDSKKIKDKIASKIIALINNEKEKIILGEITSHSMGYLSGLEKALSIVINEKGI